MFREPCLLRLEIGGDRSRRHFVLPWNSTAICLLYDNSCGNEIRIQGSVLCDFRICAPSFGTFQLDRIFMWSYVVLLLHPEGDTTSSTRGQVNQTTGLEVGEEERQMQGTTLNPQRIPGVSHPASQPQYRHSWLRSPRSPLPSPRSLWFSTTQYSRFT